MLVKCTKAFKDFKADKTREAGEQWEVDENRYRELNGTIYGKLVEEVKEEKPKTRKRTTKEQ